MRRIAIFEPSGRHTGELSETALTAGLDPTPVTNPEAPALAHASLVLLTPAVATSVAELKAPRWVFGDSAAAPRLAGAAVAAGAEGVLLGKITPDVLSMLASDEGPPVDDLERARALVAATMIEVSHEAGRSALAELASAFAADDCIIWWRDGETMHPQMARPAPDELYRTAIAAAARVAAAAGSTVIAQSERSVIAAPLRLTASEVAGLVAIVSDKPRRFTPAERTDLRALSQRLARELSHLAGHKRLLVEGDRLRAGSLHDPLTGALTRSAFEQAVTNEISAASRRKESLTFVLVDIVGIRKINVELGHHAGDEVLAHVGARVRATVRGTDPVGRFGGDDLAILLIGAQLHQAQPVAEKLLARMAGAPIRVEGQDVTVELRGVITPLGSNERSGEAAFARASACLRTTPPSKLTIVGAESRPGDTDVQDTGFSTGTTLGGSYRVLHELSRGAMGVVYRAEDLGLGRPVAIKVLRSDLASDRELVTRFRSEAMMLASLRHKNLVQVYSLGEHAGDVYFVMELVEGQPLTEAIRNAIAQKDPLPLPAIAQITLEIADALDAMHAVGLIHRDVKPANILLDRERDRAVLVDVGVAARRGDRNDPAGTPGFSAPESFMDGNETPPTDVYGLASTVYSMLTGQPPFGAGQLSQVLARQLNSPLVPPSHLRTGLTSAIDTVMAKALDPKPGRRWASAGAFAVALTAALEKISDAALGIERPKTSPPIAAPVAVDPPRTERTTTQVVALDPTHRASAAKVAEVMAPTAAIATPEPAPLGRIRGAHFRVASRIISQKLGGAAVRSLGEVRPALAAVLAPSLSPSAWEPTELFVDLLERCTGGPPDELARLIGRGTITATFARFFGANPGSLTVETVLRASPAFWRRYHDWSTLTLGAVAPGKVDLALSGRPSSPLIATLVGAELGRVAELAGGREVVVTAHRSDTLYRVAWSVS